KISWEPTIATDGVTYVTRPQEFRFGGLPTDFESRQLELPGHSCANLVETNQRLGVQLDGIGRHELHPAIDASLGGCLGEGAFGLQQYFGIAICGERRCGKCEDA